MFNKAVDFILIILYLIALVSLILKIIYLGFKPAFLKKLKFVTDEKPGKFSLSVYYLLTILVLVYCINLKLKVF